MRKIYLVLLAILSGALLSLAWPARGFPFLMFIGFIPLLYIEDYIGKNRHNFTRSSAFLLSYIAFFVWNLLTSWWIVYSSVFGVCMAVVFNSMFMAIVFHLYHMIRRNLFKSRGGFFILVFFWITFELLHLDWDLSWSWLNLGNAFASWPHVVQWYEYTGVFGGDVWILAVNILLYKMLLSMFGSIRSRDRAIVLSVGTFLLLAGPIAFSEMKYYTYVEKENPVDVVVVQPNIDPYNEKFNGMSTEEQLNKILRMSREKLDKNTDYLVCPETAIPEGLVEDRLEQTISFDSLKALIHDFPKLKIVIGISSFKIYRDGEKPSPTARHSEAGDYWFDVCNSGLFLDSTYKAQIYHKSKLVPGVEMMPFPKIFGPLSEFAIDLGGMTGSNATQEERTALGPVKGGIKVASVICYESIYGEFVTGYVRNGANIITILTNDGWWENTAGHRQHMQYARLRAIETRRSIARSANTGTSCFIDQRGDVFQATNYWEDAVIRQTINANTGKTFYVRFGDYIGRFSFWVSCGVLLSYVVMLLLNKRKKIKIRLPHLKKKVAE
ncbi:MAG: apolipoprotein N-acyltransferase [Bacteroidota bacterium]